MGCPLAPKKLHRITARYTLIFEVSINQFDALFDIFVIYNYALYKNL